MTSDLSPIVLFVYNRPSHTQKTIEALKKNTLAKDSDLFIYSDGAKDLDSEASVFAIREYLKSTNGFKTITIIESSINMGLARSIITGASDTINKYGKAIILEDDLVTSPFFLDYMNQALVLYENDTAVASIHGYTYPTNEILPDTFFLKGADCWGWGTWKRAWDIFEEDGEKLLSELQQKKLCKEFDYDNAYPYTKMLKDQINKKNDSWAIRWYASAFLANMYTLYPAQSLVKNIGMDESGTHCTSTNKYASIASETLIDLRLVKVEQNINAYKAFSSYHMPRWKVLMNKLLFRNSR